MWITGTPHGSRGLDCWTSGASPERERSRVRRRPRDFPRGPLRWPRHPQLAGDAPESIALYAYLLDVDEELAEEFDVRARIAARQLATARVLQLRVGACDLRPWFDAAARGLGLLVLDGLLALEIRVGGRTAAELVGPGDLLQPLGSRC